jgi:hypothetical protein
MYSQDLIDTIKYLMLGVGFADDVIITANTQQTLEETLVIFCEFFKERLLKLNRNKSEVLVMGQRFGKKIPTSVMGIKVKTEVKYLGLYYNIGLHIKYSLKCFKPKIQYMSYKLYRLIKIADFRTRYNL